MILCKNYGISMLKRGEMIDRNYCVLRNCGSIEFYFVSQIHRKTGMQWSRCMGVCIV